LANKDRCVVSVIDLACLYDNMTGKEHTDFFEAVLQWGHLLYSRGEDRNVIRQNWYKYWCELGQKSSVSDFCVSGLWTPYCNPRDLLLGDVRKSRGLVACRWLCSSHK